MADKLICSVKECGNPHKAKGLCSKHYARLKRHGSLEKPPQKTGRAQFACSVNHCDLPARSKHLCEKHYRRFRLYGDPRIKLVKNRGQVQPFLDEVLSSDTDECIIWPFAINHSGYGILSENRTARGAHIVVLERATGEEANGRFALHTPAIGCDRACVNPRHLRWGTVQDNARDMIKDGNSTRGEKSHSAKITEKEVRAIRNDPRMAKFIARDYGISKTHVYGIKSRKKWRHVK